MKPLAIPANHGVMGQQEKHSVSIANAACASGARHRELLLKLELLPLLLRENRSFRGYDGLLGGGRVSYNWLVLPLFVMI